AEGALRHLLPGPEAVEDRAPREALRAEVRVDAAAEVVQEVHARLARVLVHREVGRLGERQRHAAQAEAARAVGLQIELLPQPLVLRSRWRPLWPPSAGAQARPGRHASSLGWDTVAAPMPELLTESVVAARLRAAGCVFAEDEAKLILATA